MSNDNNFEQEEKMEDITLKSEIDNNVNLKNETESLNENIREEEIKALKLASENSKGLRAFFSHYLLINLVDVAFSALIVAAIGMVAMLVLRIMGFAIVKEYVNEFFLGLFIIIFIIYKSYGPISKQGCSIGEKIIK